MNFLKKILVLLCMNFGLAVIAQDNKIENDYTAIVRGLYKTFETDVDRIEAELTRIDQIVDRAKRSREIEQLIKNELAIIRPKFAAFVQYELTEKQRAVLVQLLTDVKHLTSITAQDFTTVRQGLSDGKRIARNYKILQQKCAQLGIPKMPEDPHPGIAISVDEDFDEDAFDAEQMEYEAKFVAWLRMTEHVPIDDALYNLIFTLFRRCHCVMNDYNQFSFACADSEIDIFRRSELFGCSKNMTTLQQYYCSSVAEPVFFIKLICTALNILLLPNDLNHAYLDNSHNDTSDLKTYFGPFEDHRGDEDFGRIHRITSQLLEAIA